MPDAVSVRQVDGLPRASFRFHLTMDTLASSYALGATPCARDFHPLDYARAAHTYEKTSVTFITEVLEFGGESGTRTPDTRIMIPLL